MSRERLDLVRAARSATSVPGGNINALVLERLEEIDADLIARLWAGESVLVDTATPPYEIMANRFGLRT